jgi:hypothetical protein
MIAIKRALKREDDYQEPDAILVKVLAAFGPSEMLALVKAVVLAESEVHMIIDALAQRQRRPDESPAEAFAKFITHDPDGVELYQILKGISGNKVKSNATPCNGSHVGSLHLAQ